MMKICCHLRASYPFESPQEALQPFICMATVESFAYKMKLIENLMFPDEHECTYIQSIKSCWKATDHGFSVILYVTHAPKVVDRFNVVKRQVCLASQHSWKKVRKYCCQWNWFNSENDLHARESLCWAGCNRPVINASSCLINLQV